MSETSRIDRYAEAIDKAACQSMHDCSSVHGHSRDLAEAAIAIANEEMAGLRATRGIRVSIGAHRSDCDGGHGTSECLDEGK